MRPMPPRRTFGRVAAPRLFAGAACLAVFLGVLVTAPAVRAEPVRVHPVLREFMPTGKYVFEGAAATEARPSVYFSQRAAAYLVRGTPLGSPLLVRTGSASVESFPEEKIVCRPDGGCDVAADVQPTALGTFRLQGTEMLIQVPGLDGRLKPRPPLAGWTTGADIRLAVPEYDRDAKAFRVDEGLLADLRAQTADVRVFVYFGSWCPTCNLLMGRILALDAGLNAGGPSGVHFDYYAAPNVPRFYADAEIQARGIDRIPVGLVYVDGKFVGRIVSTAWTKPEVALRNLLKQAR